MNYNRRTDRNEMILAEDQLWELRQNGPLERPVEEFLELSHRMNWPDASLIVCFLELINLILYLNGSHNTWPHQLTPSRFPPHTAPKDRSISVLWRSPVRGNGCPTALTWGPKLQTQQLHRSGQR
ncbi:hypothetical protein DPX16_18348 [Anabarilius grahami]|uniref:Uncharacterized protein n=1 Tax=Anabarilius grahami TaxID=495550 RepID=A0A3N0YEP7_ANAGA|nr:hypothetical protein DPX16_18348 [Anabarilius grahami]